MAGKQKLELTWIGKDARPKLEPRILLEEQTKSYHAKHRVSESDTFDNRLIFGDNSRTLLVCCSAFRGDATRYPNLTVKKIPKMVLQKCEWGHDDYSLNVANLPMAALDPLRQDSGQASTGSGRTDAR